jgi:hypothetical protein
MGFQLVEGSLFPKDAAGKWMYDHVPLTETWQAMEVRACSSAMDM